jgi:hypothetical protein
MATDLPRGWHLMLVRHDNYRAMMNMIRPSDVQLLLFVVLFIRKANSQHYTKLDCLIM